MAEAKEKSENDKKPKPRVRPIVRLGILLISHSFIVSVLCCTAGVLALLLLPVLAKNTYISENALMPGSANPMLSNQHVSDGNRLVKDLTSSNLKSSETGICYAHSWYLHDVVSLFPEFLFIDMNHEYEAKVGESQRIIAQYMLDLGAEVSFHKFHPQLNQFHPLHFFSSPDSGMIQENFSCSSYAVNAVGIIRAPRGDGKEAIVLVTPYNSLKSGLGDALSVGIAYSVFSLLTQVTWLAKDIIWLVADSRYGEYAAVSAWLRDYQTPKFSSLSLLNAEVCPDINNLYELKVNSIAGSKLSNNLRRAGTMAAALVLKVGDQSEHFEDTLSIYAEASNGQMPNLDLINVVNYLAVHRQGPRVKVEKLWSLLNSNWLKILGEIFESLGKVAKSLNPAWKFGIPATEYVEGTATLASSLYYQALGVPTGPHGAFRDYQVDAITLEISPRFSSDKFRHNDILLRGGRLIEGVIRSVNNLLEKFHQSFFLYLLTSPSKFVSVGVYMIAFALLIAPLPMVAASLYVDANILGPSSKNDKPSPSTVADTDEQGITIRSWRWLNSAKLVFVVHLWGAIVSLLPYFICQIPDCSPATSFMIWVLLSGVSLLTLYLILASPFNASQGKEWALVKSVTISFVFIGLGLMSVINFATAEIGALLMVPMCLLARPLKLDLRAGSLRSFARMICNLVLGFLAFPPAAFFLLKGMLEGFGDVNVGDFWMWVESLWAWNSATYVFIATQLLQLECYSDGFGIRWLMQDYNELELRHAKKLKQPINAELKCFICHELAKERCKISSKDHIEDALEKDMIALFVLLKS
ncbi:Gaa1-like, GPI transamidase component [Corchorus olitorius]|uniref:Gaa1-like, GPI transamidase component n=1 Tax=Corchorus olitorius TaxID=93759 RepID=A0A1R3HGB1_9ROSI|nr:Gaa1-like, GPI transamidase component [Corchorus olitorius]